MQARTPSSSLDQHHSLSASVLRKQPGGSCSEAAGRPVIKSQQSVRPSSSLLKPFLQGKPAAWLSLSAIPSGLASFLLCGRSSRAFRIAAVRPRQKRRKAFRAARVRPSRPLAQTLSDSADAPSAKDCAGLRPASASWRRTSIRRVVPVRDYRCTPHQRLCVAHSFGPSRPRPRRPSSHPLRRSLPLLQGACSLPSAALQSPPPLHTRPPPRPRSTSFRALWHCQTLSRHPHNPHTTARRLRDWTAP